MKRKDIYYSTKINYNPGPFKTIEEARKHKYFGPFKTIEEAMKDLEKKFEKVLFKNSQFFMAEWYEGEMFLLEVGSYFDFEKLFWDNRSWFPVHCSSKRGR